LVHFSFYA